MRALTVRQPWASVIATGAKTVENRPRPQAYRGPLAIHAGLGDLPPAGPWARLVADTLAGHGVDPDALPRGVIVAVAELVDCHPADGCCAPWGFPGPGQHLVLERIRALPAPVPAVGRLGLWLPPADVLERLPAAAG